MPSIPNQKQNSVAKSASLMGIATLLSRFMGLAREQVFAYFFGASDAADAFNIAFRIPNLLRDLFAEGAMSAAFVPNFTKALTRSKEEAFKLFAAVLTVLITFVSVITIIGIIFSSQLVAAYAGSFYAVPGKFELAVSLTKMMFPFFPLVAMAAISMGALNSLGSFFLPAFAPTLFNITSVACGIILTPLISKYTQYPPIYSMAIGVVLGGFLQFYIQWWQIKKEGFKLSDFVKEMKKPLQVPGVKQVLWLIVPGTVGLAATQLNILINSIYATSQGTGAVSWLNYAFRLMQFPIGIFGVSLAAATLPVVSKKLALNDRASAASELNNSLKLNYAVNAPAAAGLMAAGLPIIQMIFQHGRFALTDSTQTYSALFWYSIGLPGYSLVKVMVPVFYALGTTKIPVTVSFVSVLLNALINHLFLNVFHFPFWALALATAATATINAVVLAFYLSKLLPGSIDRNLMKSVSIHTVVSLVIGAAAAGAVALTAGLEPFFELSKILFWATQVTAAIAAALVVVVVAGKIFKIAEVTMMLDFFEKKVLRRFIKK